MDWGTALYRSQRGPRGEHHSRAGTENTLPGGSRGRTGADHRTSHSHCPISLQLPQTGLPNTGQMRTEWRYILKRSYFSLLSRFLFLFYNPETAVHQPPASAPQCPREQLRREVSSQSDELQQGRQAGRHRGQSEVVQITKKGKETLPGGPPSHQRKCLSVLFSSQRAFSLLVRASSAAWASGCPNAS